MKKNQNTPHGDPRDTRNLFFAIALSLAVVLGWQHFVQAPQEKARLEQQQAVASAATQGSDSVLPDVGTPEAKAENGARNRNDVLAESTRLPVSSNSVHGSISLKGNRFDDLTLARYKETLEQDSPEITLLSPSGIELPYYAEFGWRAEAGVKVPDQNSLWQVASGTTLSPEHPVVLRWDNGAGLVFEKTLSLDENYMFTISQSVKNTTESAVELHPYGLVARTIDAHPSTTFIQHEGAVGVFDGKLQEDTYDALVEEASVSRKTTGGWFGLTDKYWLVALVPDQATPIDVRALHAKQVSDRRFQVDFLAPAVSVEPGSSVSHTAHLFAGAKEVHVLDAYEKSLGIPHFDLAIDFGWFYFLTKPFFYALDFMARLFGSFGLAILAFTVIVKGFLFPLADHSYFSMAKMKQLMPRMTELRSLYANDPQKQSQEIMALYKKEGVNPLSGCWPILIQIPIFFSLYKVLYVSIEMRHAPFFGWVHDLSAADPSNIFTLFGLLGEQGILGFHLGIWPLLMGLTMWLQMKMNPPPTDPSQKIVFGMMPIIFTISMAGFPAGLVIYWTWSNLLSILQQFILMRRMHVKAF